MDRTRRARKRWKPRIRRRTKPGDSPGTFEVAADAPQPVIRVIAYDSERILEQQIDHPGALKPILDAWPVTWVNVVGLGNATTLNQLAAIFSIHPLALEDVVNVHQRAKIEVYQNHLFCVMQMPHQRDNHTEQLSVFLGKNYILSFQEFSEDCFQVVRQRLQTSSSTVRQEVRSDYLAYRLIDAAVDAYFPVLEELGDRLEVLEDRTSNWTDENAFSALHRIRRELLMLRRAVWPLRDAINQLRAEDMPWVTDRTQVYLRDCHDHAVQILDFLESYREICSDLRDLHMSAISNRMNEIMKTLTVVATIFIPLNFITGLYGMNFNTVTSPWNMPELNWRFGYLYALSLMLAVTGAMLIYFRRHRWLGTFRRERHAAEVELRNDRSE